MADPPCLFVLGSFVAACSTHVARFPQPGECVQASAFTLEPGGKGLNLAVGARRLGASVDGLIAAGNDLFGQMAATALTAANLSPHMLRLCEGPTGAGIGFIDASGETAVAVYPGANWLLSVDDIRAAAGRIAEARFVLAQFEIADPPIAEAFAIARAAGKRTILNPSPFRLPRPELLADTSILIMNTVEAAALLGSTEAELDESAAIAALQAQGPEIVILTRGAQGAVAYGRNEARCLQPGFAVDAVDALGAGDAFTAGLAASLVEDRPFAESLRRAAACGALTACRRGVFDALPTLAELEAFLGARDSGARSHSQGVEL